MASAANMTKFSISDRMHTDIRENWGPLVEYCRRKNRSNYSLIFLVSALSFGNPSHDEGGDKLIKALISFAIFPELQSLQLPQWPSYLRFRPDSTPNPDGIAKLIIPFKSPLPKADGEELGMLLGAKQRRRMRADREVHDMRSEDDCRYLAKVIAAQWPCPEPDVSKLARIDLLVDVDGALGAIRPEWLRLYQNWELHSHLKQLQHILNERRSNFEYKPRSVKFEDPAMITSHPRSFIPSLRNDLMVGPFGKGTTSSMAKYALLPSWTPLASIPHDGREALIHRKSRVAAVSNARQQTSGVDVRGPVEELRGIVQDLAKSRSSVRQIYAQSLLQSLQALEKFTAPQQLPKSFLFTRDSSASQLEIQRIFGYLKASLEKSCRSISPRQVAWLQLGGLWPAITTVTLLEQLRATASPELDGGVRHALISLGLAITRLQREMRLNDCVLAGDISRFQDEEANVGHTNWNPADEPDWLLLELESNILIRPEQVDVARATIFPPSGENSVLQMNMGQGKTSCIMPMVAASMADGQSLVRVIVPKALLLQTAQLFQSRLGGLLNRRICHVPFSRRTPTTKDAIRLYIGIHKRTMEEAGVMLCLPEHCLSFMLSGQQRILDSKIEEARSMIRAQSWLKSVCRDILDECDYTLATRTQLIFPSGSQMSVDGHPHRWHIIQSVLGVVDRVLYGLQASFPHSIEVVRRRGGGFPLIYFIRRDAEDELLHRLAADITKGYGDILPVRSFRRGDRIAVMDFLAPGTRRLQPETLQRVQCLCPDQPRIRHAVYLLRGLLVHRILIMVLRKRWNVQYGLRPGGDPIAVPFHAKGVPSEQSEWGHPDVAILFTCLTFYYDGTNEHQFRQALGRILKSDDPSTEYAKWTHSSERLPVALRTWSSINIEDDLQVHEIWEAVRYQVVVIDYFLNNFVFPQHAKQFKVKLQSSG